MFRWLQHCMKGCSKLERLDFIVQTAFKWACLKVSMSAVAEAVLCYRSLDNRAPKPITPMVGSDPCCTALLVPVHTSVGLCWEAAEWSKVIRSLNTPQLVSPRADKFVCRSVQLPRSLWLHKPCVTRTGGVGWCWLEVQRTWEALRHQSSRGCQWRNTLSADHLFADLLSAKCLHQNSNWSKTSCERHPWLAEGSFWCDFERIKQRLMSCSLHGWSVYKLKM